MSTAIEAEHILEQVEQGAFGDDPRQQLNRAIRLADEAGADEVSYRARMLMTDIAHWVNDADAMLTSFAWCVAKHDSDPARFPIATGEDSPDLLFQHKWIAGLLAGNSRFPAARVDAVLDDMERRFLEAGLSRNGVLQARRDVALDLGDLDAAARYAQERDLTPRDDYSHCEACVRSTDAGFAALLGDEATAIRLWEDIHAQDLSCGEEPEYADSQILLALLRAGRADEAMAVHARSYRVARTNPDAISMVRFHFEFLAVTGNVERGIDLLERHLPGFVVDQISDQHHMTVLRSIAVLLDAAVDAGLGDRTLRGSRSENAARLFGAEPRDYTIAEFGEQAWAAAERLARALDARNRNDHYLGRIGAARALREERYDVPFSTAEAFAPAAPAHPEPVDAAGWVREARRFLSGSAPERARTAAERGLETAGRDEAPLLHAVRVWAALAEGDDERAAAAHRERVAALAAAGRTEHAEVESRLGLLLMGCAERSDADRIAEEIDRARTAGGDASVLADLLITHASLLVEHPGSGDADAELALAEAREAALVLPDEDPDLLWHSVLDTHLSTLTRAELFEEAAEIAAAAVADPRAEALELPLARRILTVSLASKARFAEAAEAAEALIADAVRTEDPQLIGNAAMLAAQIYDDLDRPREASARAAFGVRTLDRVGMAFPGHRHTLASLQLGAGQPQEALENFQLVLDELRESDDQETAVLAKVASGLGEAAKRCGEYGLAYRVWGWAARIAEGAELWGYAAAASLDLADLLHEVGDEDAPAAAEHAVELARRSGVPALVARGLQVAGWIASLGGDAQGLAALEEAIATAEAADLAERAADARISLGRALLALGRTDDGAAALRAASESAEAKGLAHFTVLALFYRASGLAASDRAGEALDAFRALADRLDADAEPELSEAVGRAIADLGA
ncbi:hypothetical protein [Microbacterium halophytorum]|uniref:hypothetical protein n=1 Tax=Microbacterium halophytorum TaxID=2067568 RepID=UPI000CFC7D7E|nr:hypothetical protein [Microbacterium halophytorum]